MRINSTCFYYLLLLTAFLTLSFENIKGQTSSDTSDCSQYLSHYWKFEDNNNGVLSDYAGTLDGSVNTSALRVPGIVDYGWQFNGLSEASVPDDPSFDWNSTSSFTIEFWLNKSSACPSQSNSNNNVVIGRDDAGTQLHWWAGVSCLNPGKINFNLVANNGSGVNLVSKQGVIDGNWHHIALVRDGSLNTTSIYIDGTRDTTVTYAYTGDFASSVPVNIGWLNLLGKYHLNAMLDELALYSRPITADEITAHYNSGIAISYCEAPAPQPVLKIMPLGNSITFDNNITDTRPVGDKIAYRYPLYNLLTHAGYPFDFVGSEYAGYNFFPDAQNAGFPGIRAYQITQLLNSGYNAKDGVQETPGPYLDNYLPDIILLHIGTNAVQESAADIENILNEIDAYKTRTGKNTKVIVARIINRQTYNATTTTYNINLANVVTSRNDPDLFLIDMENGAGIDYAADMTDNLHPNPPGYGKMAMVWFNKLGEILPARSYKPFILLPPSDNGTVNTAYESKVYVIGNPAPSYSLIGAPSGMTIHAQTGIINWLPNVSGDFPISVVAANAFGSDTVTFNLTIHNAEKVVGNTTVYNTSSGTLNRRAQPVVMPETGIISSITIYHTASSGNAILAIYNTSNGKPNQRIAVTQPTIVNNFAGWQTFDLTSPVTVSQGETIWLAWVFEKSVSLRYTSGTPGRAQSALFYSGGMPELFGSSSISSSVYSVYASYTISQQSTPNAPSSLSATAVSPTEVHITWTDQSNNETGFEIERSLTSGSGFQTIHTTTSNTFGDSGLNPGQTYYYRVRAFNNVGYSAYTQNVQITTPVTSGTATVGYTQIFSTSSGTLNRRAQPVVMPETGTISSITIYHTASSGNAILAIYNTSNGKPNQRIGVTQPTTVNNVAGWQTFDLISPVTVSQGETIWLAWVFEKSVSLRYTSGTPGRANSSLYYAGGMPELFGSSSISSSVYSVYASYTTSQQSVPNAPSSLSATAVTPTEVNITWTDQSNNETGFEIERSLSSGSGFQTIHTTTSNTFNNSGLNPGQTYYYRVRAFNNLGYSAYTQIVQITLPVSTGAATVGYTQIFSTSSGTLNRRAQPVVMPETGTVSSITIYHTASSGNAILAIYNTSGGKPNQRIAVTQPTTVSNSTGWQTFDLISPVTVNQGETIWLAWVFEKSVSLRYTSGTPGRAQSALFYPGGMPELFGSSSISSNTYSVYANYNSIQQIKSFADTTIQSHSILEKVENIEYDVYPSLVETGVNIRFNLPEASDVQISIYNISGHKIMDVTHQKYEKGAHHIYLESLPSLTSHSSQILFVRLLYNEGNLVRKIVVQ